MPDLAYANTGARIRAARIAAGMTQQELATAAGIGLRTVIRAEAGEIGTLATTRALASALGMGVAELLEQDEGT